MRYCTFNWDLECRWECGLGTAYGRTAYVLYSSFEVVIKMIYNESPELYWWLWK